MFTPNTENTYTRLQDLINISFGNQWDPEKEINWKLDIKIPEQINSKTYIDMVSQLYYAEEATITILGHLLMQVPDFQAKQYLGTQAMDEARHAQVYLRYLKKLGDIAPINENLHFVLEQGLNWKGNYCGTVVALNVIMEGEAVKQQQKRIETLPCPLFQQINKSIVRDEARHAAFGVIYMKEKLPTISIEEKNNIAAWIGSLWNHWEAANRGRYNIEGAEILKTEGGELNSRWHEQLNTLTKIGLIAKQ